MKGKLKILSIILTFGLLLVGCSEETTESAPKKEEPKTEAVEKEDSKKEEPKQE
ncbi:hypothetical protein ABC255_16855 [Neobacillus sp. 3P2-tot-E-2]|uniref:hypothetical protein n=1 Tax=Neobacillus sp. 3P2-tot-E-2 TaxID=3132212 RepID=UPI0039A04CE2